MVDTRHRYNLHKFFKRIILKCLLLYIYHIWIENAQMYTKDTAYVHLHISFAVQIMSKLYLFIIDGKISFIKFNNLKL